MTANNGQVAKATLSVQGMTCGGESSLATALSTTLAYMGPLPSSIVSLREKHRGRTQLAAGHILGLRSTLVRYWRAGEVT